MELDGKVIDLWDEFCKESDRLDSVKESDSVYDMIIDLEDLGYHVSDDATVIGAGKVIEQYESLPSYIKNQVWESLVHLSQNIRQHANHYDESGRLTRLGSGLIITRMDENVFQAYIMDNGPGFPLDKRHIPRIADAIKDGISLSNYGEDGIGLTDAVKNMSIDGKWEIICNSYSYDSENKLTKKPIETPVGVLVYFCKYL
ncbi:MAG: hypothetical protein ACLFPQ_06615 [Candidatus Woesearchaeota archaeon]